MNIWHLKKVSGILLIPLVSCHIIIYNVKGIEIEAKEVEGIHQNVNVSFDDQPSETCFSASPHTQQPASTLQQSEIEMVPLQQTVLLKSHSESASTVSEGHRFHTKSSSKQAPDDDRDICLIEEIDISFDIPSKLTQIDYPKVADAHKEDVAKVIRKKFSKLGINEGHTDIFSFLSSGELQSSFLSWQAHIEEAVRDETDEFWENVCSIEWIMHV